MKLSEITPIQILGGVLVVNTVLVGGVAQLTDLFGATMANHILNACILGSGICGGFIMNMGGLGAQARNVVNGGASIAVGPYATTSLATLAMDPAQSKIDAAPGASAAVAAIAKAAAVILFAFIVGGLLMPGDAQAQVRLKSPKEIAADVKHAIDPSSPASTPSKPGACDITLFQNLSVANVVTDIQNCIGSVVAGGAAPFVTDITAALKSATDAKDGTAVACLGPALAIATAAEGTPAVTAADGTVTTPAVYPGPILIFQKYREFVTAGGPSNCKTAVQSTINGTVASAF